MLILWLYEVCQHRCTIQENTMAILKKLTFCLSLYLFVSDDLTFRRVPFMNDDPVLSPLTIVLLLCYFLYEKSFGLDEIIQPVEAALSLSVFTSLNTSKCKVKAK